jgi:dTDP-4-dehydrorhamnose reductase
MRFLVTGAGGQLGRELVALLENAADVEVVGADHGALAVEDAHRVDEVLGRLDPDVVLHVAALTDVDQCERDPGLARSINETGTANVARAADAVGAHLLYVSTDYVFDGWGARPYRESDPTDPVSVYGATKLAGELACPTSATVVRTAWVAGQYGANFVRTVLGLAAGSGTLRFVDDQRSSPTFAADLAPALVALARDRRAGLFHVTNAGEASRFELARETLVAAGADPGRASAIATADLVPARPARRPAYSALDNGKFHHVGYPPLPAWQDGLARLVAQLAAANR